MYDPNLKIQINGTVVPSISNDYPYLISIGPSYFESYETLLNVQFSHGFNLGKNTTEAMNTLIATVPLACKALGHDNFAHWEMGNEPDLFARAIRPATWNETDYVAEWLNKTRIVQRELTKACTEMGHAHYNYLAPSFAGTGNRLNPLKVWEAGFDSDSDIGMNSMHK